ncbi:MAG TPA: hypothetical protein VGI45_29485 [Terracidiphilus sp.]
MKYILNASPPNLNAFARVVREPVAIGRILLILATISLLTMPLTQHIWTWDHFLHGGQDFESGMLVIVTVLSLAVLLSQLCKQQVDSLFASCCLVISGFQDRELAGMHLFGAYFVFRSLKVTDTAIGIQSLPLKI